MCNQMVASEIRELFHAISRAFRREKLYVLGDLDKTHVK